MLSLSHRVAVVTGGGSGIGRATAVCLARSGARIAVLGRDLADLLSVVKQIADDGQEAIPLEADVTDPRQVEEAMAKTMQRWGRMDVVFANAGINGVWAPIEKLQPEEWRETIDVNLTGAFLTIKYAVPHMKKAGGSIIVCSSINGTRVFANGGATAYACSKAGQVALAQMLALELAEHRIRVNVICPGAIETPIHDKTEKRDTEEASEPAIYPEGVIPLTDGKAGSPEQVAQLVLFLASDASSHITGTPVWIDGGQSLLQG